MFRRGRCFFFTWIGHVTGNINIFVRPINCYWTVAHYVEDFLSAIVILFMYLFLRTFDSFLFIEECVGAHSLHTSLQTCGTSIYWLQGFIGNRDSDKLLSKLEFTTVKQENFTT